MKVEHTLTVTAMCPMDDRPDSYEVVVEAGRVVPVERILEVAASFAERKIFQEDLTEELARAIGARVTSYGWHSKVRTKVVAG